jgi:hypothetical protein
VCERERERERERPEAALHSVLAAATRLAPQFTLQRVQNTDAEGGGSSLALMSIVGYILGLGDRHPSNLMLHRYSGKLVHVDFGDCFEVSSPTKALSRLSMKALFRRYSALCRLY